MLGLRAWHRSYPRRVQGEAPQAGALGPGARPFGTSAPCGPLHEKVGRSPPSGPPLVRRKWRVAPGADLSDLVWTVAELVSIFSRSIALRPGALIIRERGWCRPGCPRGHIRGARRAWARSTCG